jgi:hypothetical protein
MRGSDICPKEVAMKREMIYTSLAVQAFVTLILTIANGKTMSVTKGGDMVSKTFYEPGPTLGHQAFEVPISAVSRRTQIRSRLLTIGPFLTLILTLRYRKAGADGVCWPGACLRGGAAGATVL